MLDPTKRKPMIIIGIISIVVLGFLLFLSFSISIGDQEKTETVKEIEEKVPGQKSPDLNQIAIKNVADITQKRTKLINQIWKEEKLPSDLPDEIQKNIKELPPGIENLENLQRIDKITIQSEYGVNSIVYHLIPLKKNRKLILYHQGHGGNLQRGEDAINSFLKNGWSVMTFYMPLTGENNRPTVTSNSKTIDLSVKDGSHNNFPPLETGDFSPIKFFVNPLTIAINFAEKEYDYTEIAMMGISGGGWTTVLYSAIDERIIKSYPIAGSLPLSFPGGGRDYEQNLPGIRSIANYRELYVLGSYGTNRKQLQIFNRGDPCCYSGRQYLRSPYEETIDQTLQGLGPGEFEVFITESSRHEITRSGIFEIFKDFFRKEKDIKFSPEDSGIEEAPTQEEINLIIQDLQ